MEKSMKHIKIHLALPETRSFPRKKGIFPRFPVFYPWILSAVSRALFLCRGGEKGEFLLFRTMMQGRMGEGKNGNPEGEDAFRY